MKKLKNLRLALWEDEMSQAELARRTGINRTYIVFGINGRLIFTEDEKKKIAKVLKRPAGLIFEV